jgi:hypothetical protein
VATVAAIPGHQPSPDRWVPFPNTADRSIERQPSVSRFARRFCAVLRTPVALLIPSTSSDVERRGRGAQNGKHALAMLEDEVLFGARGSVSG